MSKMYAADITADGATKADVLGRSLIVMLGGSFGSGTLSVELWSDARGEYRTVAAFTAVTTSAQEVYLGAGQTFRFVMAGSTTPSLEIDYWFI